MKKIIYEGDDDKLYGHDEFCDVVLAILGSESVLRDADKDWSIRHRYNVLYLDGVTIMHSCDIDNKYGKDARDHCVLLPGVNNIKVSLHGEDLSVLYVEKKIKDAVEKARVSKEKNTGQLEQLVSLE